MQKRFDDSAAGNRERAKPKIARLVDSGSHLTTLRVSEGEPIYSAWDPNTPKLASRKNSLPEFKRSEQLRLGEGSP